jgi:hypothetical protein
MNDVSDHLFVCWVGWLVGRRLGVQEGSTRRILDHPFFSTVDIDAISNGTFVPEFIPVPNQHHEPLSNLMPVRPFNGDQTLFAEF